MPFLWLAVNDSVGPHSDRAKIERNSIALLSNYEKSPLDPPLNMIQFHALQRVLDEDWRLRSAATSDSDLEHLEKYVQKIKDTKFRHSND